MPSTAFAVYVTGLVKFCAVTPLDWDAPFTLTPAPVCWKVGTRSTTDDMNGSSAVIVAPEIVAVTSFERPGFADRKNANEVIALACGSGGASAIVPSATAASPSSRPGGVG